MKWAVRALAALGLLWVVVTVTPLVDWWTRALQPHIDAPSGDVLILPGGDGLDDVVGYESYWRCVYGVRAWRTGQFREIFITGGVPPHPVSVTMRDFLIGEGVPANVVRVETESTSTRENALFTTRALAGTPGIKLVYTPDYFRLRACRAFHKAGLDVRCCSFPYNLKLSSHWYQRWPIFIGLCTETTKIAYYWSRGWI